MENIKQVLDDQGMINNVTGQFIITKIPIPKRIIKEISRNLKGEIVKEELTERDINLKKYKTIYSSNTKSESIIRFWKIAYIFLFDIIEYPITFQDKEGIWECNKLFWNIYWCNKVSN